MKTCLSLKLKDLYAIKHALQASVENKKKALSEENSLKSKKGVELLEKDIEHENALAEKFESEILYFREKYHIEKG